MRGIKKVVNIGALMLIMGTAVVGVASFCLLDVRAASCTSGDGKATCQGECCVATATTCTAGPCTKVSILGE